MKELEVVEDWDSYSIAVLLKKKKDDKELTEKETYFLDSERMEWENFDKDVKNGARSFVTVGRALKEINVVF